MKGTSLCFAFMVCAVRCARAALCTRGTALVDMVQLEPGFHF